MYATGTIVFIVGGVSIEHLLALSRIPVQILFPVNDVIFLKHESAEVCRSPASQEMCLNTRALPEQ